MPPLRSRQTRGFCQKWGRALSSLKNREWFQGKLLLAAYPEDARARGFVLDAAPQVEHQQFSGGPGDVPSNSM